MREYRATFERFTERARQVVVLAQDEARRLKHNFIGSEHILLGLVRENEGVGARILLDFDADAEKIRNELLRRMSRETGRRPRRPTARIIVYCPNCDAPVESIGTRILPAASPSRATERTHVAAAGSSGTSATAWSGGCTRPRAGSAPMLFARGSSAPLLT